ncbi:MAG: type VI secretion system protein TssL, long form [Alphaproteobacteria bacterium]|nr:type VI secretion system protein TssL, long form [Alphaproteobacteria bacterium]
MTKSASRGDNLATVARPSAVSKARAAAAEAIADVIGDPEAAAEPNEAAPPPAAAGEAASRADGTLAGGPSESIDFRALLAGFRLDHGSLPAMVVGAGPLLALAHSLYRTRSEPDVARLRDIAVSAVRNYERDLAGARIAPERARAAHYVVCALIDDVVLSQTWGVRGGWARSGLVSSFHMDVTGGERVFDLLAHFHRNPGSNRDLLLLIYLCLSLGFEGRTRVSPRGKLELMQIREGLYRTLANEFGSFERELSPHWRGESARHKPAKGLALLWTLLGLLLLGLALGYLIFTFALNRHSDKTMEDLASIRFQTASLFERPKPVPVKPVVAVVKPPQPDRFEPFIAFLQPEVKEKLVTLTRKDKAVLVRIYNAGLFDSGSAVVKPVFNNVLMRIGRAISEQNFKAIVVGHTDNVPIRTLQYPSNWHLSEARARVVAGMVAGLTGPGVITFEGRADTEPVGDNATPEGREANRRTEILVLDAASAAGLAPREPNSRAGAPQ